MSLLNPVVSAFTITSATPVEVYVCPAGKTHAIVDLSFLKDDLTTSSLIAVYLAAESNPAALTSVDSFIDDIELVGTQNSVELSKVVVGQGQRLYVGLVTGTAISVRVSGMEENNAFILGAGRLAASSVAGTAQVQLWHNNAPTTAYASVSITAYNSSSTTEAVTELWVSDTDTPTAARKVMNARLTPQDTTIVENVTMRPGERLYVRSSVANAEYFVNGVIIKAA